MSEQPRDQEDQEVKWVKIDPARLKEILDLHKRFVAKEPGGKRAILSFHDLSGIDLSHKDLSGADLTGAKMSQARLSGASFCRANLYSADLRMASLQGADFTKADLRGICLRGADLSDAVLAHADIRQASLARYDTKGDPQMMEFEETPAQLTAIVALRANLSGAKVSNSILLQAD
ncbi:MAG: pentapeptide repeat-containing protein [Kiloniellales bacterium]